MKTLSENSVESLEFYAKSENGLWVKAEIDINSINVYWQKRYKFSGNNVFVINAQGNICEEIDVSEIDYDSWVQFGKISIINDYLFELCDISNFDLLLFGLMRHVCLLTVLGYGETPDEVASWFDDFDKCEFICTDKYIVSNGCVGLFEGLENTTVFVENVITDTETETENEDIDVFKCKIVVTKDSIFEVDLDDSKKIGDFIISTIPY